MFSLNGEPMKEPPVHRLPSICVVLEQILVVGSGRQVHVSVQAIGVAELLRIGISGSWLGLGRPSDNRSEVTWVERLRVAPRYYEQEQLTKRVDVTSFIPVCESA